MRGTDILKMEIDEVKDLAMSLSGREVPTCGSPPDARNGYIDVRRVQLALHSLLHY